MKGDHQHYIPQHLQRGFAAERKGKLARVWYYAPDQEPSLRSMKSVGAQRRFYSDAERDGVVTLDGRLTRYENGPFNALLNHLREQPPGSTIEAKGAAEAVAHLSVRNAHIRDVISFAAKRMAFTALDLFGNEQKLRQLLGLDAPRSNAKFEALLDKALADRPEFAQLPIDRSVINEVAFAFSRENFDQIFAQQRPALATMIDVALGDSQRLSRDAHVRILEENFTPEALFARLRKLRWRIEPALLPAVLPDCIALSFAADGEPSPIMMGASKNTAAVAMPIASDRFLVGLSEGSDAPGLVPWNVWAASCSSSFFISAEERPELDRYRRFIGGRAFGQVAEAIASGVQEFEQGPTTLPAREKPSLEPSELIAYKPENAPEALTSYPLGLVGFGDAELAGKLGAAINNVMQSVASQIPLLRLDGITMAFDLAAAAATLDLGYPGRTPEVRVLPYGAQVAMMALVVRDGVPKGHVLLRADFGQGLLSEDPELRQRAEHTLVCEFARVACLQIQDEALPGSVVARLTDQLDYERYPGACAAWQGYFAARAAGDFMPTADADYRSLLIAALDTAAEAIPRMRLDYRFHADTPRFAGECLDHVRQILQHAGSLLGHCDGFEDRSPYDDEGWLAGVLEKAGLLQWFELLRRELGAFWDRRGEWQEFDEFLALNQHVDRLLWPYGIYFTRTPDGMAYLNAPVEVDAARLPGETLRRSLAQAKGGVTALLEKLTPQSPPPRLRPRADLEGGCARRPLR